MSIRSDYPMHTWKPSPGSAPRIRRVLGQAKADLRATLSNGEQLLLTLVIPIGLLVVLSVFSFGESRGVDEAVPSVMALAVLSTAFTSLAIGTGFDRRSGALKFLGTTPLTRVDLLSGRAVSILVIEVVQMLLIVVTGLLFGWRPAGSLWAAALVIALGTIAFATLGFALAGLLRAEATLAVANAVFLLLMLGGGIIIPSERLPGIWSTVVQALPSGALADALRSILLEGAGLPPDSVAVLFMWAVLGGVVAARTFRWQ